MVNLNIEMPDDLAQSLEGIAAAQHKSIQQLALERLIALLEDIPERRAGSPAAGLRAMQQAPLLTFADVEELDASSQPADYRSAHVISFRTDLGDLSSRYECDQRTNGNGYADGVLAFVPFGRMIVS